ncbi:unnamed protein product [Blepharisma stoltei]|uniref:Uncharacterized protein n=1 Tax=Blepharisma stoltei TaxID=1481888 RepID=A0AAU9JVI3_9CILI|nr:unnamed protein product [Blepharisma stoltei]
MPNFSLLNPKEKLLEPIQETFKYSYKVSVGEKILKLKFKLSIKQEQTDMNLREQTNNEITKFKKFSEETEHLKLMEMERIKLMEKRCLKRNLYEEHGKQEKRKINKLGLGPEIKASKQE